MGQIDRATMTITHMRSFARRERREGPRPVGLSSPLDEALSFFHEQFRVHDIELVTKISDALPKIAIHANEFEQIVVNLISNARYAVDKKGEIVPAIKKRIEVRLFPDPERSGVALEVQDNGIGMSEDEKNRCLEPFFSTKEVGQGTGLGLYIIHGIVKELKGNIQVEGAAGRGSRFRVSLPVAEEPTED